MFITQINDLFSITLTNLKQVNVDDKRKKKFYLNL